MDKAVRLMTELLAELDYLCQLPDKRSRELSLTLTNAEVASYWLERAAAYFKETTDPET